LDPKYGGETYALIKGNLGDIYIALSFVENRTANLERGTSELETAFANVSPKSYPRTFAENAYKLGKGNMFLAEVTIGTNRKQLKLRGLGQVACSLVLSDRLKNSLAETVALTLKNSERELAPKFKETLAFSPQP
jgi:hypothetical protein